MNRKVNKVSDVRHRPTQTVLTDAGRRLPVPWIIIVTLSLLLAAATTWTTTQAAGPSPGAPTGLQIAFDLEIEPQAAMTLRWNAPASDGGSAITGYQYRWKARSGNFWIEWTDIPASGPAEANAGSYTLTGLTHPYPPQVYTFEVRAVSDNGAGPPSNQDTRTYDAPSTINEIRTTLGDGSITLEWDTPASNGRRITHYQYAVIGVREGESPHTVVAPRTLPGSTGDTTSVTLTGLTNGMPHSVALGAVNAVGTGSPNWTEDVVPATGAAAPTDLAAEPGDGSVTLSWTAPASDGGSPVTGYSYQQKEGTGNYGTWTEAAATAVETTEHTVTGLTNGTVHTFRVRAETSAGSGAASAEASATPLSVPSGPAGLEALAGNAQVTLTWNAPTSDGGTAVTSYQHRHRPAGGTHTEWTTVTEGGANANTITLKELINGTVHTFEVRATSDAGKGAPASVDATPRADPPSAPTGLSALHFDRSAQLNWTAPETDGGSPVIRYEYRQKADGADFGEWTAVPDSGTGEDNQAAHRAGDLANGTQYTLEVRAVNNAHPGPASNQASATPRVIRAPKAPRDHHVSSGDGQVVAQWAAPDDDGGRPVLRYEYCLNGAGVCESTWTTVPAPTPGAVNQDGRGYLAVSTPNSTYTQIRVRAVNTLGAGPERDMAAVSIAGAPAPPANLTAEAISSTQVRVTWSEPADRAGTKIISYNLERSPDGFNWKDSTQPTGTTTVILDAEPGAENRYRMRTRFSTDEPLTIGGTDFSRASSPCSPLATASTAGAEQTPAKTTVNVADSYAHEGTQSNMEFTVYLKGPLATGSTATVDYRTQDGTATAGEDYTALSGTLTLTSTERTKQVSVPVIDDQVEDSEETFTLFLSNPSGAELARTGATGTIYNEETLITGITLVDAASATDLTTLDGGTITLDSPQDGQYTLRADAAEGAVIGSVRLELSGAATGSRIDNDPPYTLHATGGQGLPAGVYTALVTVHPDQDGAGTPHQTMSTSFTIAATPVAEPTLSAILTAGTADSFAGYSTFSRNGDVGSLSDDTFTVDGTDHAVKALGVLSGDLIVSIMPKLSTAFVLTLDTRTFATSDATKQESRSVIQFRWSDNTPEWSDGDTVAFSIDPPAPQEQGTGANSAPTGLPAVNGTPEVDQTLTADTSDIDDADGLNNVTWQYQWTAGGTDIAGATGASLTLTSDQVGQAIRLRVTFTDDAGNSASLTSPATAAVATAPATLTASFSNVPTSRSGSSEFTFDLAFSENLPLSYKTLRDHAFNVDGGRVKKAQRKVPGSNQTWTITLKPASSGAVTVTLPVTTDCNAQGAICTQDGRKQASLLDFTVPAE